MTNFTLDDLMEFRDNQIFHKIVNINNLCSTLENMLGNDGYEARMDRARISDKLYEAKMDLLEFIHKYGK